MGRGRVGGGVGGGDEPLNCRGLESRLQDVFPSSTDNLLGGAPTQNSRAEMVR